MKNQTTEQTLLIDAINGLRCAGQDRFADHLSEKLEEIAVAPKIAIFVEGGLIQGIRSNISQDLEVEIIDKDNDKEEADDSWDEIQKELEFGNY
jgi:hypothetical protein